MLKITPKTSLAVRLGDLKPGDCFLTEPFETFAEKRGQFVCVLLRDSRSPNGEGMVVARIYGAVCDTIMNPSHFESIALYPVHVEMTVSPA